MRGRARAVSSKPRSGNSARWSPERFTNRTRHGRPHLERRYLVFEQLVFFHPEAFDVFLRDRDNEPMGDFAQPLLDHKRLSLAWRSMRALYRISGSLQHP